MLDVAPLTTPYRQDDPRSYFSKPWADWFAGIRRNVNTLLPPDGAGVNIQTGATYTFSPTDFRKLVVFNRATSIAATLPQATVLGFGSGFFMDVENLGAGPTTITPTVSTIDGATSLVLRQHQGVRIFSDGTNYYTLRGDASGGVDLQTGATYTFVASDARKVVSFNRSTAIAATLPQATTAGFGAGFFMDVENRGAGPVTITPTTSTIDGATSIVLHQNRGVRIFSDGTNYYTQRGDAGAGVDAQTGATYTFVSADFGKVVSFNRATAIAATLPQATTAGFGDGFFVDVENIGAGPVTITPTTSTIDGAASLVLYRDRGVRIFSDGINYYTMRGIGAPAGDVDIQTGTSYTVAALDAGKLLTISNAAAVAVTLPAATTAGFTVPFFFDVENRGAGAVTITPTTSTIDGAATLVLEQNTGVRIFSDGTNYYTQRGGGGNGAATGTLLDIKKGGTDIGDAEILDVIEGGNIAITGAYDIPTKKVSLTFQGLAGDTIAPFTLLFEWDGAGSGLTQFEEMHHAKSGGLGVTFTVSYDATTWSTSLVNVPWHKIAGVNGGPDDSVALLTDDSYAPVTGKFLVIEAEGHPQAGATDFCGLGYLVPGSEWTDGYFINVDSAHKWRAVKRVSSTVYLVVADQYDGGGGGGITVASSCKKARWLIYPDGATSLYVGKVRLWHHDMSAAGPETTTFANGRVGLILEHADTTWLHALRIYLAPLGSEQLFG